MSLFIIDTSEEVKSTEIEVKLIRHMGDDWSIAEAAWVSTETRDLLENAGFDYPKTERERDGVINYLAKHRHGTPYEHNAFTWFVKGPIFVFREFHRHRIGWGYNERSGRYQELPNEFYLPAPDRNMVNVGTSARPVMGPGSPQQYYEFIESTMIAYEVAWDTYKQHLAAGVANELARIVLPVGLMSAMYATCNLRSLLAFLSLRTHREDATFVSYPQREIEMVAEAMEAEASKHFPVALAAFQKNGRVAP